jgi:hypothetical protein
LEGISVSYIDICLNNWYPVARLSIYDLVLEISHHERVLKGLDQVHYAELHVTLKIVRMRNVIVGLEI